MTIEKQIAVERIRRMYFSQNPVYRDRTQFSRSPDNSQPAHSRAFARIQSPREDWLWLGLFPTQIGLFWLKSAMKIGFGLNYFLLKTFNLAIETPDCAVQTRGDTV